MPQESPIKNPMLGTLAAEDPDWAPLALDLTVSKIAKRVGKTQQLFMICFRYFAKSIFPPFGYIQSGLADAATWRTDCWDRCFYLTNVGLDISASEGDARRLAGNHSLGGGTVAIKLAPGASAASDLLFAVSA